MKKSTSKSVRFELVAEPDNRVCVAGTFNDWHADANPLKDNPEKGHYRTTLRLQPGRYEYKFVVNGQWLVDPNCDERVSNGQGGTNSVITV